MRYILIKSYVDDLWYIMDTQPIKPKLVSFFRGKDAQQKGQQELDLLNQDNLD